jgi:hypothetical protein
MQFLTGIKDYLSDRPETAFLALCIFTIVYQQRELKQSKKELVDALRATLPLMTKFEKIADRVVAKLEGKNSGD